MRPTPLFTLLTLTVLATCISAPPPPAVRVPIDASTETLSSIPASRAHEIDRAIEETIADGQTPGGVLLIESGDRKYLKAYGNASTDPEPVSMREDTIFDVASLTKVIATTPAILHLVEKGKIDLDDPITRFLPEMDEGWQSEITVRHLITHTSGLPPGLSLREPWSGYEAGIELATRSMPVTRPGIVFRYSDINFILLGEIATRASGRPMHELVTDVVYEPLGMSDTGFLPDESLRVRIAPTEIADGELLHGVVHDPTSRRMGGTAGHAGLFTTVSDIARYARMILNDGELDGVRVFEPETVELMKTVQSPPGVGVRRTAGFDYDSTFARPRGYFPLGSFGHTGWTGAFIWIDPASDTFLTFLSNRVYPDGKGSILGLYRELGTMVSRMAGYESFPSDVQIDPRRGGAGVWNGIDRLSESKFEILQGKRVGLITNHTGRDGLGNLTLDLIRAAPGVDLVALFSPEHGIRGVEDSRVDDLVDEVSGLPVYSLYGERRKPSQKQLDGLDILVFDIQDVGTRFYTYISTMGLAMEAAAEAGIPFVVLDRINPINGTIVEGPVSNEESHFIDFHPITVRHGMTIGELAKMFREERMIDVDLQIVELRNWKRDMWQDQSGTIWINTSPNIRNLDEAILYPGIGILEMMNLSVGRGTATPFEIIGAPFVDGDILADRLDDLIPETCLAFTPVRFTPEASKFAGEQSGGVTIDLVDRDGCDIVRSGVIIGDVLLDLYGDQLSTDRFNFLLRDQETADSILRPGLNPEAFDHWSEELASFLERRSRYLIYE